MKNFKKTISLIICAFMTLCIMLTGCSVNPDTSSGSGSGSGSGGGSDSGKPTPTVHTCESKCPVCGLCLDMECTEDACIDKCGDSYSYGKTFTIAQELKVAKASMKYDKNKGYYTGFNKTNEGAYSFAISSPVSEKVNLTAFVYKTTAEDVFTTVIKTMLNGEKIERASTIHSGEENEIATVNLGCITLKEGENVIDFIAEGDAEHAHEMTGISISYAEEDTDYHLLPATEIAHTCKEKCEVCGGCVDFSCVNPGCTKKCKCQSGSYDAKIFSVLDERANNNGRGINAEIDGVGCTWNKETRINYNIRSDFEGKVKIGAVVSCDTVDILFTDQFNLTLNGEKVVGDGKMPMSDSENREWSNYKMVVIGEVSLVKGKNTFVFSQTPVSGTTGAYNFQSFIIFGDAKELDWYVPGPDDHELVLVPAKAATCTEEGNVEYYACTHCDKIFADIDAVNEITDISTVKLAVDANNHANIVRGEDQTSLTCNDCKKFIMYDFDAMDDRCISGGVDKNNDEKCIPGKNGTIGTITYYVVSDKDVTLSMYVNCSAIAGGWSVEFNKTWSVDIMTPDKTKTNYTSETIHHNFNSLPDSLKGTVSNRYNYYVYEYVCEVTLKAGVNEIVLTSTGKESLNFRNLAFKNAGDAKLTWGSAA